MSASPNAASVPPAPAVAAVSVGELAQMVAQLSARVAALEAKLQIQGPVEEPLPAAPSAPPAWVPPAVAADPNVEVRSLLEQLFAMLVEHGCQLSDYDVRAAALPPRARLTSCGEISWRS